MSEAKKILEAIEQDKRKGYYINVFLWISTKKKQFATSDVLGIKKWFDNDFAKAVKDVGLAGYIDLDDWKSDTEFNNEKDIIQNKDGSVGFDCTLLGKFTLYQDREDDDHEVITSEIERMLGDWTLEKVATVDDYKIEIMDQ